ncbi:Pex12 amino terminal region-domain-containing protein [Spinellus fusiger]|nr:Pex12 amino terminal region-domain-containing protein [Spinellus fusiger]
MEFMSALGSQEDASRPSLFEVVAQEKLRELLQPAVQYVLAVSAQRYPRLLIRIVNHHEEFYSLFMFFVERHYLKGWGGSFAENFYGLKRVSTATMDSAPQFTLKEQKTPLLLPHQVNKSLLMLVGVPYIKSRLDLLYQQLSGGQSASLLGVNEQEEMEADELKSEATAPKRKLAIRLKRLFRLLYPYLHFVYGGSHLVYQMAYLFGKSRYTTPWLHWAGLEMKRMSGADYHAYEEKQAGLQKAKLLSPFSHPLQALSAVLGKSIEFLKVLLPMSIFFFKFLEWWYASEFAHGNNKSTQNTVTMAPPQPIEASHELSKRITPCMYSTLQPDPRGIALPITPNTCPLCLCQPIVNPTALFSGYVFCYTCIYRYVEDNERCPVSWQRVSRGVQDLTKIYADTLP